MKMPKSVLGKKPEGGLCAELWAEKDLESHSKSVFEKLMISVYVTLKNKIPPVVVAMWDILRSIRDSLTQKLMTLWTKVCI